MVHRISASDPRGLNKGRGLMFCVGSRVRQETPEEDWRKYRPKRCKYNKKDEDNSPKTLNDETAISCAFIFNKTNIGGWFRGVMAQFELIKHDHIRLPVHLAIF